MKIFLLTYTILIYILALPLALTLLMPHIHSTLYHFKHCDYNRAYLMLC